MLVNVKAHKRHLANGKIITIKGYTYDDKSGRSYVKRQSSYKKRYSSGDELKSAAEKRKSQIKELYKSYHIKAPSGKGAETHTIAFHKKALAIMKGMRKSGKSIDRNLAYAIAMKQLGRDKAVMKKHWR